MENMRTESPGTAAAALPRVGGILSALFLDGSSCSVCASARGVSDNCVVLAFSNCVGSKNNGKTSIDNNGELLLKTQTHSIII